MKLTSALFKNYLTTAFGILAGLPMIVSQSGLMLDAKLNHYLLVASGIGIVGLGIVAKAFNVHSTADQVEQSTEKANGAQKQ